MAVGSIKQPGTRAVRPGLGHSSVKGRHATAGSTRFLPRSSTHRMPDFSAKSAANGRHQHVATGTLAPLQSHRQMANKQPLFTERLIDLSSRSKTRT